MAVETASGAGREALTEAADAAFADGPDYFAVPADQRRHQLAEAVADARELEPAWIRDAQRVARAPDGEIVGLLLLREVRLGVTLETVGVVPAWRRRSVGVAMLKSALAALPEGTEVRSRWLVANRESGAWHRRMGFEVIPTSVSRRSEQTAASWAAGGLTIRDLAAARTDARAWEDAERDGRSPDPFSFAQPIHRRRDGVR